MKNGSLYTVWGKSDDPSTWYEKNSTLSGAPERQLRREIKQRWLQEDANYQDSNPDNHEVSDDDCENNNFELISTDLEAFSNLTEAIKTYAEDETNFFSTLDIDKRTDEQTIVNVVHFCKKNYQLKDVEIISGLKITLKLVGFNHHKAKSAII